MEKEKNNKGVIICLISIIVVLATLCISLEAGVFNSNKTTDNSSVNSFLTSNKLISTSDSVSSNMPDGYVFLNNGRFAYYNYSFDIGYIIGKNGKKEIDYNRMISGIGTWTINNNELILKFEKEEHAIGGEEIDEPPYPYLSNYKREIKNVNKETKYTINKIDKSSDTTPFLSLNNNEVKWYSLSISEEYINIPKELAQNGYSDIYNQLIKTETDTPGNITNNNSLSTVCTANDYDKLEILSMENKTEKIGAIGGSTKGYNVTTTVTKEHSYTSTPENKELYTNDYLGTLFVLYKNKLYYTNKKELISKYCETINSSKKLTCDYSKFNDDSIKEFTAMNINADLKTIGSYGNAGSGSLRPYAVTTDGKVISINEDSSHNYNGCGVMYDNSEYPIDRIFNMYFYDGVEYTILLKDGTLITRDVDREHPIEFER